MRNRSQRLQVIADIINNNAVASQEEILLMLAKRDYNITQATLSRDLKLLRTNKVPNSFGGYTYVITPTPPATTRRQLPSALMQAVRSVAFSGNMVVIKTRNGYASSAAYDIDSLDSPMVLGTIPGADTLLVVLAEGVTHNQAKALLYDLIPREIVDGKK